MPDLAERTLDLAHAALAEQERTVAGLRTSAAALLTTGGVLGGLLGRGAFAGGGPDGAWPWLAAICGLLGASLLVGCSLVVFSPPPLAFGVEPERALGWWLAHGFTSQPSVDLLLADAVNDVRLGNLRSMTALHRCVRGAACGLVLLTVGLSAAAIA